MASIGDLVVNLTAKTDKFRKEMRKARAVVSDFALNATILAGAAAGAGMLKLAADAETLQVKFRVLLKSGDAAAAMMKQIGDFAAATPFEKMDIAGAAQKLLAFNVPAGRVMGTLKNIGDISALTGNRIGELAELYGKAHVQGRLFMEDINQLTGRGIPIIQELAKQFGVAEGSVRDLVSTGKVSAANISRAFADMTSAGGQFTDGMAQLSETAAGKFSTLKDNVKQLGEVMGSRLLPIASSMLATMTRLTQTIFKFGRDIVIVGGALVAAAVAMRAVTLATQAYTKAVAIATALSGPAGWKLLAVGVAAATVATLALNEAFRETNADMQKANTGAATATAAIGALDTVTASTEVSVRDLAKSAADFAASMQSMESPIDAVARKVSEFREQLEAAQTGIVWDNHPLVMAMRQKESGFTGMLSNLQNELKILRGEATETGLKLAQMTEMGIDPTQVEKLKKLFGERDAILAKNRAAEEWRQKANSDFIARQNAANAREQQIANNDKKLLPSQQRGSKEALETIMRNMKKGAKTPEVVAIAKVEKATNAGTKVLQEMFAAITKKKEASTIQGAVQ